MQVFTVAALAVFAHNAIGEGSKGFALAYAAFQLILTFLWWRTGIYDPDHHPLSRPYSFIFPLATLIFAGSVFVAEPWRYYRSAIPGGIKRKNDCLACRSATRHSIRGVFYLVAWRGPILVECPHVLPTVLAHTTGFMARILGACQCAAALMA